MNTVSSAEPPSAAPQFDRFMVGMLAGSVLICAAAIGVLAYRLEALRDTVNWSVLVASPRNVRAQSQNPPGNENRPSRALVSIDLFNDFACRYCRASAAVVDSVRNEFGDSVAWNYRYLPRTPLENPVSYRAALVAYCAAQQGKLWQFYRLLSDTAALNDRQVDAAIRRSGMDPDSLDACEGSQPAADAVWRDLFAAASNGIEETPTVIVDGLRISSQVAGTPLRALLTERLRLQRR